MKINTKIKLKQKKGFLARDFIVYGIIFGMIVALYVISVASVASNYNNTQIITPSFAQHYSTLQTNLAYLNVGYNAVKGTSGLNLIGTFNVAFNSMFTAIVMVWNGIAIYAGMAQNVSSDFNFLDQTTVLIFLGGLIAIETTYLMFIWLSSVTRGKL